MKMKYILLMAFICVLITSCSQVIYFDSKDGRYATSGDFVVLTQKEDTPISLSTVGCCGADWLYFRQIGGKLPNLWYTNTVFAEAGDIKFILVAKDKKNPFLPTFYVAFSFKATEKMNLHLVGNRATGFKFVNKNESLSFNGQIFQPENVSDAFKMLSLLPAGEQIKHATVNTIHDLKLLPAPVFSLNPMTQYRQSGEITVIYDLDSDGRPINIGARSEESDLSAMAKHTLAAMRFQKTKINEVYVERKKLSYTFSYNYSVVIK